MRKKYSFTNEVWLYPSTAGQWHFISLPKSMAEEIKKKMKHKVKGWGAIKVEVKIGKTKWETCLFPDKRQGSYILPLKALVRSSEDIRSGDSVEIDFWIKEVSG